MRERYTYDIATSTSDGRWVASLISEDTFSRDPESIARSLLEQWIIDNQGRLPGGRVFVYGGSDRSESVHIMASVRVRVFRGDLHNRGVEPVAVAYLGHAESDYPRSRPPDRGHSPGEVPHRLQRVRFRLRMPSPRHGDREGDRRPVRLTGSVCQRERIVVSKPESPQAAA
jgi:hypothetical protein